jgi:hypothetical protein
MTEQIHMKYIDTNQLKFEFIVLQTILLGAIVIHLSSTALANWLNAELTPSYPSIQYTKSNK